jgi:hypothetical protein
VHNIDIYDGYIIQKVVTNIISEIYNGECPYHNQWRCRVPLKWIVPKHWQMTYTLFCNIIVYDGWWRWWHQWWWHKCAASHKIIKFVGTDVQCSVSWCHIMWCKTTLLWDYEKLFAKASLKMHHGTVREAPSNKWLRLVQSIYSMPHPWNNKISSIVRPVSHTYQAILIKWWRHSTYSWTHGSHSTGCEMDCSAVQAYRKTKHVSVAGRHLITTGVDDLNHVYVMCMWCSSFVFCFFWDGDSLFYDIMNATWKGAMPYSKHLEQNTKYSFFGLPYMPLIWDRLVHMYL